MLVRGRGGLAGLMLAVGCLLGVASLAAGQVIVGSMDGTVRDESGLVLPGATVTLTSPALPAGPAVFTTDRDGRYRFRNLPPGLYRLSVELSGFTTYVEEGLRVQVGGNVLRNVSLRVAALEETVTVTGESPIVDTKEAGLSTNYENEYLQNTPLRRFSMFDFIKSAPGMSATAPTRGSVSAVSAYGSGIDENTWLMDGTDFTSPVGGAAWPWPDTDVIEEIEIVALGASAEYQVAGGAVINVITKQGTNEFRADANWFGSWDSLTSKPITRPCNNCSQPETGFTREKFQDFTVHGGLPLKRDKMWIYGGYQYQRDYDSQPGTDPRFFREFEADRVYWKYTWQINNDVRFMHNYHDDYWVIPSIPSLSRPHSTINTFSGRNPSITFGDINHVLSDTTFYDLRVSGFYSPHDRATPNNPGPSRRTDVADNIAAGGAYFNGGFTQARTAIHGKLTHYASRFLGASHEFKFGVQFVDGQHTGHYGYTNNIAYYDYLGAPYYAYLRERYDYGGKFRDTGAFVEDLIQIGDRVTLQVGVRYDHVQAISQGVAARDADFRETSTIQGLGTLFTNDNFGPRVGFNIKLDEAGKTILRGNWGLYYRQPITGDLDETHPGLTPVILAFWAPPPGREAECSQIRFDGSLAFCFSDVVSVTDPKANLQIDRNNRSPRTSQFSIGMDRELVANTAVGFTYVRKDGSDYNGWHVDNAEYGRQTVTLADGQQLEVFPILTDPSARIFRMSHQPRFFMDYDGFQVHFRKRWAHNWQAQVAYNWSDGRGLLGSNNQGPSASQTARVGGSGGIGRDPNDFTNATGNLLNDRTHMFTLAGAVEIPKIGVLVGANYRYYSGKPWGTQARVRLPQGNRNIYIDPPGSRRLSSLKNLDFRVSKLFRYGRSGKVEFLVDVLNLTNDTAFEDIVSRLFTATTLGEPSRWVEPRRAMIGLKWSY